MNMRKLKVLTLTVASAAAVAAMSILVSCDSATQDAGAAKPKFDPADSAQQVSYVVGNDFGKRLKEMDVNLDIQVVLLAFKEAAEGAPAQLSDSALTAIDRQFKRGIRDRDRQRRQQVEESNLAAAQAFLDKNRGNEGVVVTESGLQYQFLQKGTGSKPKTTDQVRIHYHGTLPDGTVFDSSRERGEPVTFAVTGVIPGWTELLQLIPTGSKVRTVIPPDLAYGRRGARGPIGPNMALIFEIELVEIVK